MEKEVTVRFQSMVSSMWYQKPELLKKTKDELLSYARTVDCKRDWEIEMFRQAMDEVEKINKMSKRFRIWDIVKVLWHDSDDNCSYTEYYLIKWFNICQCIYFTRWYNLEQDRIKFDYFEKYSDKEYKDIDMYAEEIHIVWTIIWSWRFWIINDSWVEYYNDWVWSHIIFHKKHK